MGGLWGIWKVMGGWRKGLHACSLGAPWVLRGWLVPLPGVVFGLLGLLMGTSVEGSNTKNV